MGVQAHSLGRTGLGSSGLFSRLIKTVALEGWSLEAEGLEQWWRVIT